MPKKPRGSPRRKTESPLHVRVKVNPRAVGVGGADLLLFVSLENRGADEIRDVVIEWDLPSGFVQAPEKGESPPHVTPRGRRTAPMDRLEGRKPPKGLTASRALSADGAVAFHRILPQATVHGVVVLRPVRVGRFTARVESITFVDAAGEKQVVSPDASATFSVEEPVAPQIQVAARSARDAALGEPLPVDIRIENAGNMPARGLTLNFKLPDGLRLAESGANEVHLGPIDVEGHRHRIVHIALLPQAPGDVTIDSARVSFQGSAEAITVPAFTLRLEVRVDPARVFVGRDRHREKLAKLLESVALPSEEASSRLVLVAGRAGIGKSRLVEEIKTRARLGGYLVADARCGPTVTDGPGVLPALITSLLDLGQLLRGPVPDQEAIDRHLHRVGRTVPPPLASGLYAVVRYLRTEDGGGTGLAVADPAGYFADLVRHLTKLQPMLLAVDDIHWTSAADKRTLSRLLVGTRDCRVLSIMTYREEQAAGIQEYLDALHAECAVTDLRLGALNYEACRALVSENFVGAEFPDWLVRAIHTRSRGVPLYEVEALRCLVLDGTVRFDPAEGWKADDALAAEALNSLPGTASGLVAHQVNGLRLHEPNAFRILQDSAVLGNDATLEILAAQSDLPQNEVENAVRLLVTRGIFRETPGPHVAVEFSHPLKSEVAMPGPLEQIERHAKAAEAIARVAPDAMAGSVANHLVAAGRRPQAYPWFLRQARHSEKNGAHQDALSAYEQAARLVDDPEVSASPEETFRPLLALLMERGSAPRSLAVAETVQDLASRKNDRALESEAAVARARSLSRLGRDLEALQAFYAALDLAEEGGRAETAVTVYLELSEHYRDRDREEAARRVVRNAAERFLALSQGAAQPPPSGSERPAAQPVSMGFTARAWPALDSARAEKVDAVALVAALSRADCMDLARLVWERAFAEAPDDGVEWLRAMRAKSYLVAYTDGEDAVAQYLDDRVTEWDTRHGAAASADPARLLEGAPDEEAASWLETMCRALLLTGNTGRALQTLDASWARRGHQTSLRHRARYLADRANLLAGLERGREAAAHAAEYVQVARALDEPHLVCDALLNAAYLALNAGDSDTAESTLNEGMAMARDRSMPSLLCRAQLLIAGFELVRKQVDKAHSWCRQARRLAEDHGLSPELLVWAATEMARCRAAMGDLAEAAAECRTEAERLIRGGHATFALPPLRAQAGYLLELGELRPAREALERAVQQPAGRPGGRREREQAYRELAEILLRQGDLEAAVGYIQESLAVRRRGMGGDALAEPAASSDMSSLEHLAALCERLQMIGQGEAARELIKRTIQSLPEEDSTGQSVAYMTVARLDSLEGETGKARENLDRALGLLGPAGRKPRGPMSEEERLRRRARVLVRAEMGRIEATVGNFERARGMLSGARREAAGLGDEEVMHGVLAVLGRVQEELGQVDEARATWEEITRGVKRSLASAVRLEAFMGLARIAVAQDRLDEAVVYVQAAEEAALEAGWMGVAMMGQVAEAWEVLGEPERSLGLIDRAVTIVRLSGVEDRARLPAMLQVKARLLCQVGPPQFQEAVRSAEEAVEISRQVGDPTSMAENMEGMAHILILAGEDSRAVEQFHAARHVYERLGHEAGAGRVHGHLARLHLQSGDADAARGHLDEALRLGAQVSTTAPEVLADALLTAASMEHEQGHAAETTAYLLAYLDLCLANSDVAAAVTALHGLDEQPPGHDLIRVSADQWRVLDHIIESAQSLEDVVECRLAGMKAAELRGEEAEYDRWLEEALHTARQCPPSRLDPAAMDDLARALEKRGNLADAANVYRALAARGDSDDLAGDVEEMRAYACGRAGELLTQAGQLSEGLQAYFEAERHAEKAASPIKDPGIAWNAFAIASIHLEEGRAEESKTWYKKAVQRWQALIDAGTGEIEERHNFISMLALAQVMSGEPGDALATMERFRARVEQQGRTHLQTWLVAACDLSEALIRQGNQDAAIYALNECLAYVGPETLPDIACRVHTMMSWMHAGKREIKKAFDATERALALVPDVADPSIALQAWVQLATLQSWMRDTDSAARTHLEVIRLSAELGDWKLLLEHRESLVLALAGAGALDEARVAWSQLQQARASAQEQLPDLRIPRAHFALAAIHLRTGDTGRARELILQDLVSASALEGPERVEEIAFLLSWLGTAYKQEGEWREAIAALNQCVEAVHGNPADGKERGFSDDSLASVYLELCEIHARLEQWDEAEESLAEAEKRAASDPWVERRLEGFREAVKNRTEPPSADPLQG